MQNPHGRVVSLRTGSTGDQALVEIEASVVCQRCASGKGCGAGLLGSKPGQRQVSAAIAANINPDIGDIVQISLQPSNVLQAAVIVYGYPLAGAVLGALIAYRFTLPDAGAALAALSGIVGGYWIAKVRLGYDQCLKEFIPTVSGIIQEPTAAD